MTIENRRKKAREWMAEYRKTDEYREWLISSRELRRTLKEKYRRQKGALTRDEIAARASARAAAAEARRVAKTDFLAAFVGPPTPRSAMSKKDYYAWRARNEPEFYARELDRAQRYKARTRAGYRDSIIKWSEMPAMVKEVKHLQYLISRQINRRSSDENH